MLEWYIENIRQIIARLKSETQARVALVALPPMGENLSSPANQNVRNYNQALQELAAREGVTYLPLYDRMAAYLEQHGAASGRDYDGSTANILGAVARHYMLRQSFDTIGRQNGYLLLTDSLHLNHTAAGMAADEIEGFLKSIP
jgi:lysophospholipase L1-like esterase